MQTLAPSIRMKLLNSIKKVDAIHFGIVSIMSLGVYFYVFNQLKNGVSESVMYASNDSRSYRHVMNWLVNGKETNYTLVRTLLYPFFTAIVSKLGGITGIWISQLILWLATIQFSFWSLRALTRRFWPAYLAVAVLLLNVSLIAMTLHALTEILTAFLLSGVVIFLVRKRSRFRELDFIHGVLLGLALLTMVRPTFLPPMLFTLVVVLPIFYWKKYFRAPKQLLVLVLAISPLLIQVGQMKVRHDTYAVSEIGANTFRLYYMTKGIETVEKIPKEEALVKTKAMTSEDQLDYIFTHFSTMKKVFFENVEGNIIGKCNFIHFPNKMDDNDLFDFVLKVNKYYLSAHWKFIFLIPLLLVLLIWRKQWDEVILVLILSALTSYYILVSGFSFSQGDRLVLPVISVWVVLYAFTLVRLLELIWSQKTWAIDLIFDLRSPKRV